MSDKKIAVIAVAYNRTESLARLLESLERASYLVPVTLIISIDKSNTDAVERMADGYHWPHGEKRVTKHEKNLGLRVHMLSLGGYFDEFDALIVLEDDVTVVPSFYYYAQACVEKYYDDDRIAGVSLYSFSSNSQTSLPFMPVKTQWDVYFMNCAQSWGEVWMKKQWLAFKEWYDSNLQFTDVQCTIDKSSPTDGFSSDRLPRCLSQWPESSWLKYHTRYCIEEDKFFVYPYFSLSTNNADAGVNHHEAADTFFQANMLVAVQQEFRLLTPNTQHPTPTVCYDGFFQARFLGKYLDIAEEELCVDLFSEKPSGLFRRYVLTNRLLPYKVARSFALQLRPVEMNIICGREGSELFLYDTSEAATPPKAPDRYAAYAYFYQKGFYKVRTMIGLRRSVKLLWEQALHFAKLRITNYKRHNGLSAH